MKTEAYTRIVLVAIIAIVAIVAIISSLHSPQAGPIDDVQEVAYAAPTANAVSDALECTITVEEDGSSCFSCSDGTSQCSPAPE